LNKSKCSMKAKHFKERPRLSKGRRPENDKDKTQINSPRFRLTKVLSLQDGYIEGMYGKVRNNILKNVQKSLGTGRSKRDWERRRHSRNTGVFVGEKAKKKRGKRRTGRPENIS